MFRDTTQYDYRSSFIYSFSFCQRQSLVFLFVFLRFFLLHLYCNVSILGRAAAVVLGFISITRSVRI